MNEMESNGPLVSVVVPNYNYGHYLDERLESILNQTYGNLEVIILDDCSTDNSRAVIEKYRSHEKVSKIIYNEANSGSPFKQWQRGIEEGKGDIIWIAESDDFCSPDFLETLVSSYVTNQSVLAFCHSTIVDANGRKLYDNHQMRTVHADFSMDGKNFIKDYLAFSNEVQNASCAIFSKKAALEIDRSYMDFKGAGDWLFWLKLSECGGVSFVTDELNCYRLHTNTTSRVVKSGVEFHEVKSIYEWLLAKSYLSPSAFASCRKRNLLQIYSYKEIPEDIKTELFDAWKVTPWYKAYIQFVSMLYTVKSWVRV